MASERLPILETINNMDFPPNYFPYDIDQKWELAQYAGAIRARCLAKLHSRERRQTQQRAMRQLRFLQGIGLRGLADKLETLILEDWKRNRRGDQNALSSEKLLFKFKV